jgi:hypothetical protein
MLGRPLSITSLAAAHKLNRPAPSHAFSVSLSLLLGDAPYALAQGSAAHDLTGLRHA